MISWFMITTNYPVNKNDMLKFFHRSIFIIINEEYEVQKLTSKKLYSEIWMDIGGKISIKRKYFRIGEN